MKMIEETPGRPQRSWAGGQAWDGLWNAAARSLERWHGEWKPLAAIVAIFLAFYYLPVGRPRFDGAVIEALELAK